MTLEEAIKVVTKIRNGEAVSGGDYMRGLKLGIEALEAYQELRQCTAIDAEDIKPLPSETEE